MSIAYPPIGRLGVIGDRRTAAMIAADGTLCWLCLPDYNGDAVFASLVDAQKGGHWYIGPVERKLGKQSYHGDSAVLVTQWNIDGGTMELTDFMPWPHNDRPTSLANRRAVIRRVRVTGGPIKCMMTIAPHLAFHPLPIAANEHGGIRWQTQKSDFYLWSSTPLKVDASGAYFSRDLNAGQDLWLVLEYGIPKDEWNEEKAHEVLKNTLVYWDSWRDRLTFTAPRRTHIIQSAKLVHLLSFAPRGSLVAAPTSSLPERIGGSSNYDYRYAWLRDASLSLASLSTLGDLESAEHYMDWLTKLDSEIDAPLQPLYQIDGNPKVPEQAHPDLFGYRGSQPVRTGNQAYRQYQPDSYGYFAECALIYLQQGGKWKHEYWELVHRLADFIAENWQRPSHGIWELPQERHFVSSKVMSWVTLDRAIKIVRHLDMDFDTAQWQAQMEKIHQEVMLRGWSSEQQCFVKHYDGEQLDASVLLMSVLDFLPGDHPKILSTIERLEEKLSINGLIYRFDPQQTLGPEEPPLGEFEGAFLPTTFFMATAYARAGLTDKAEAILEIVEKAKGETGLIAEELDARNFEFLGNTPLVFSLVEYIRAIMELDKAKPLNRMALMAGMLKKKMVST